MKVFLGGVRYLLLNETGYVHGTVSFWSPRMRLSVSLALPQCWSLSWLPVLMQAPF